MVYNGIRKMLTITTILLNAIHAARHTEAKASLIEAMSKPCEGIETCLRE